jgi:hypothetical protein
MLKIIVCIVMFAKEIRQPLLVLKESYNHWISHPNLGNPFPLTSSLVYLVQSKAMMPYVSLLTGLQR